MHFTIDVKPSPEPREPGFVSCRSKPVLPDAPVELRYGLTPLAIFLRDPRTRHEAVKTANSPSKIIARSRLDWYLARLELDFNRAPFGAEISRTNTSGGR